MMRKLLCLLALCLLVGAVGAIPSLTDYKNTTSLKINITPSMGAKPKPVSLIPKLPQQSLVDFRRMAATF